MPNICPACNLEYPTDAEHCLTCGLPAPVPNGYPNVVLAERPDEKIELQKRYDSAIQVSTKKGTLNRLRDLESAVQREARLVTACEFNKFFPLADRDNSVFPIFQRLLEAGLTYVGDDLMNQDRLIAEEATIPGCTHDVQFAAVAINDNGLAHYGNYFLIWNLDRVAYRTSLFFSNCLTYRYEQHISLNEPAPLGLRSSWEDRHLLAVIKCCSEIALETSDADFPTILLRAKGSNDQYDVFIEGHIWGPLTRRSLQKVICNKLESSTAKAIFIEEIAENLRNINIEVEGFQ